MFRFASLHRAFVVLLALPPATGVIVLHPSVLARYEAQLNQLQTGLANDIAAGDPESAEQMRD